MIEWIGFALMCWSLPSLLFAIWTIANLFPRAIAQHKWYKNKFDYPPNRKAIIPYIFQFNNMHNFRQKIIPNSSINLEIEILSIIENIDLNRFLKTYKISNLWNGKFFIKRIIKKIFKYQLSSNIKWNNNFWDLITVNLVSIDI